MKKVKGKRRESKIEPGKISSTDPRLLRVSPTDNVLVAISKITAGEQIMVEGRLVVILNTIELGHKIAARDIKAGEKIIKYGAPIGTAITDISCGEHVHIHNLKSDYIPTLKGGEYFSKSTQG